MILRFVFGCLGLAMFTGSFVAGAQARDDQEGLPLPAPMARPMTVRTFIGQPVEIPLEVAGRVVEPLTFLVRRNPQLGELGEIRRTGRNRAVVTYTPRAGVGPAGDEFTFAAKSPDSPVSAPAKVLIEIQEEPTDLRFPAEVDFGDAWIGEAKERILEFRNAGGGVAYVSLRPEAPWSVRGATVIAVPSRATVKVAVVFKGDEERDYFTRFLIGEQAGISLRARARKPLVHEPLKASIEGAARDRTHAFKVTNLTDSPRRVTAQWPDFIEGTAAAEIPPGETVALDFSLKPGLAPAFSASANLTLTSDAFSLSVPVNAEAAPPELAVAPAELRLRIPELPGATPRADLILTNSGGSVAQVSFELPSEIVTDPPALTVPPGGVARVQVRLSQLPSTRVEGRIVVRAGSDRRQNIPFVFEPTPAATLVPPVVTQMARTPPPTVRQVPRAAGFPVRVAGATTSEVTLDWAMAETPDGFDVERREIYAAPGGAVREKWHTWPPEAMARTEGGVTLRRIPSNTEWTVRVVAKDRQGKPGRVSSPITIATQPSRPFSIPIWVWSLLVLMMAAGLWRAHGKRMKAWREQEDRKLDAMTPS